MPEPLDPDSFELQPPAESGETENNDEQVESLGKGFLAKIPEQDRDIVAKYVKDWDAGVTQKFQSIHEQYKPYKELGADPDRLKALIHLGDQLNNDPYTIYKSMTNLLRENDSEQFQRIYEEMFGEEEDPEYEEEDPEFDDSEFPDGIPPQVAAYLEQLGTTVEELQGTISQQQQAAQEAAEFAQLDNLLQGAHTTHGDFDDDIVLFYISQGHGIDEAVDKYKSLVGGNSQARRPAPSLMGSQGGVPSDQVDPTKLAGPDRRALVEQILELRKNQ